ncbi:hypothetical protein ACFQZE_11670 [Paenibacillus sp. GCM10027627]|uniref:hypothetical protein n=1 Tax=unclassified Paenibacillus TaxID=185978 RepID=UPI00362B8B8A
MNSDRAKQARSYCEFIQPDRTCAIMAALATESDPRCKYWREQPAQCRYFESHILKRR